MGHDPIHLQLGVYQGDPLSVIILNTVMNTLVDSITQRYSQLGYSLTSVRSKINLLQYTDGTSLIGDGPSSCQHLLSLTESWLAWSWMRASFPKCVSVVIKASLGKAYNPKLSFNEEPIPYFRDTMFRSTKPQWPSTPPLMSPGSTFQPRQHPCWRKLMPHPSSVSRS